MNTILIIAVVAVWAVHAFTMWRWTIRPSYISDTRATALTVTICAVIIHFVAIGGGVAC